MKMNKVLELLYHRPRRFHINVLKVLLLELSSSKKTPLRFVQVGGNDGVLADPIGNEARSLGWHGLIMEPVPIYFDRLVSNYAQYPHVKCLNCGVSDQEGFFEIHYLDEKSEQIIGKQSVKGCASADRGRLSSKIVEAGISESEVEQHIQSFNAPIYTLDHLLEDNAFTNLDLLVVDVEGHEREVLSGFSLGKYRPKMMIIEVNDVDVIYEEEIGLKIASQGYDVVRFGEDLVCFDQGNNFVAPLTLVQLLPQKAPRLKRGLEITEKLQKELE